MISTAVTSMLKEADSKGSLIPVSSLNDNSGKLSLLSVIVKTRPRSGWFWKKPKYQSRGFTLRDVLSEDSPLCPSFKKTDFVDHSRIFGDKKEMKAEGKMKGLFADLNVNVMVNFSKEQESSFGSLKKEEVEVKKLLNHLKDKRLDMTHPVIEQSCAKPRGVLCVLTERIVTSQPCLVTHKILKSGNICAKQTILSDLIKTIWKASAKQSGSKKTDSSVSLTIPENTVIAFSLIELWVKHNGTFDLRLFSDDGGFEQDKTNNTLEDDTFYKSLLDLNKELEKLSENFPLLSVLPSETRFSLLQLLRDTMKDREEVSALEGVLDSMCDGKTPDLDDLKESERKTVQAIMDLVDQMEEIRQSLLSAIHLIVSAMEEMTEEGLSALESCCSPPVLQALQILVRCVAAGTEETRSLTDEGLTVLTEEEVYGKAVCLFDLFDVILKRDKDTLRTEMKDQPGQLPLVLSIAVQGLASLVTTV